MRKNNTQPLKEVLREYIEALGHTRKLKEVSIISRWENLMGKTISRHTQKIYISKKTLFVYLDSSIIRNELMMRKESIIRHLNESAGERIIENLILR
jgi:predicted nucleic acid-binding Zn ribbon protein